LVSLVFSVSPHKPGKREKMIKLKILNKLAYGVGHVHNDIAATIMFSFSLLYMQGILGLSKFDAGMVLLAGQIFDAIFNIIIGAESDKISLIKGYGRRKGWHLVGSVFAIFSLIVFFTPPPLFVHGGTPSWVVLLYLIAIQLMFQLGWAVVQIGHLALIPQLTSTEPEQVELNSIRQCFTYFASIIVFLLAGVIIKTKEDGTNQLTWDDCWSMQTLCYIISAIGTLTTVFFHICTPERATQTNMLESTMIATVRENYLSVSKWFKRPGFYRTCALYTLTRMIYNLTQCYIPVYVSESMNYPTKYVGYVPLVLYIAGCVYSALVTPLVNWLGKKAVYTFTGLLVIGSSIWFEFIYTADDQIWGLAVLLGAGSAGVLILSLAVIGNESKFNF
jgi:Na+/melibiose symporter-like transporter